MSNAQITATEFAKSHTTDPDFIKAMGIRKITPWKPGDKVTYAGFKGTVQRHYANGMFEVRLPGGVACVDGGSLVAA